MCLIPCEYSTFKVTIWSGNFPYLRVYLRVCCSINVYEFKLLITLTTQTRTCIPKLCSTYKNVVHRYPWTL